MDPSPRFNLQSLIQACALVLTLLGLLFTISYHAGKFHQEHQDMQRRLNRIEDRFKNP